MYIQSTDVLPCFFVGCAELVQSHAPWDASRALYGHSTRRPIPAVRRVWKSLL